MCFFFFSSRRRHTRWNCDWSSDVCSSDLELVEQWVVAHDHVRALADDELLRLDPPLAQLRDLAQQHDGVDHDAVADDAGAVLVEDAGGHQLELELAMLSDDGVAGVVAALGADDHLGLRGEVVDDLAFALVAPLAADQDDDHYLTKSQQSEGEQRPLPGRLRPGRHSAGAPATSVAGAREGKQAVSPHYSVPGSGRLV